MAVIITDMVMPKNCYECHYLRKGEYIDGIHGLQCNLTQTKAIREIKCNKFDDCPLKSADDYQPVIHAKWEQINKIEHNVIPQWKCSECGAEFECFDMDFEWCPRCGAEMVWLQESEGLNG